METLIQIWKIILPYVVGFAGWFLYCFYFFKREKDKADALEKEFPLTPYFNKNWDNWIFSLVVFPFLVYHMEDVVFLINKWFGTDLPNLAIYNLLNGVITELFFIALAFFGNKIKKIFQTTP